MDLIRRSGDGAVTAMPGKGDHMIARFRRAQRHDDGAAAVELALVLPILIMLVFGIVAFGFVFAQSLSLGNSAREGARLAVVTGENNPTGPTCAQILTAVQSSSDTLSMTGSNVYLQVTRTGSATPLCPLSKTYTGAAGAVVPCAGSTTGDELTVIARYTSQLIVPLVTVNPTFDLQGKGVFRCEFS